MQETCVQYFPRLEGQTRESSLASLGLPQQPGQTDSYSYMWGSKSGILCERVTCFVRSRSGLWPDLKMLIGHKVHLCTSLNTLVIKASVTWSELLI